MKNKITGLLMAMIMLIQLCPFVLSAVASLLKEYDEEKGLLTLTAIAENGYKATKRIFIVNN